MMVNYSNGRRLRLKLALAGVALSAVGVPLEVQAQSAETKAAAAAQEEAPSNGDIVVTAQRRSESMMSVPVAISAFSGESLTKGGIATVQAVQIATPALVVNNTGPYFQAFIRGIGSRLLQNGFDPSVATYIDGRYISRQTAMSADLFDVQRVEVLKGPQGVLFGRNASAGAIRIITNEVSDQAEGMFKIGYGNYNHLTAEAMGNMPITENFGIRISGITDQRDGFATNIDPRGRREWDDKNLNAVRAKARFDNGSVDANLTLSYWTQNDTSGNDLIAVGVPALNSGIAAGGTTGVGRKQVSTQSPFPITKEEFAGEFSLGFDLGGARLSSITTYADLDNFLGFEGDGTSAKIVDAYIPESAKTFAQELQISSDNDGPIDWITGIYYYRDKTAFEIVIDQGARVISQGDQVVKTTSYAAFGQIGWQITDGLKLIAGGRYTKDKKHVDLMPTTVPGIVPVFPARSAQDSWAKFTPSATLEYKFNDSLAYLKFARGFKSGGFNYPITSAVSVDPEQLDMYEVGLKTSMLDRKLRLTMSGYYYDYKNLQVSRAAAAGSAQVITQNAANARLYGIDADVTWNPVSALTLAGGVAWQHSEYRNYDLATVKVYRGLQPGLAGAGMIDIAYAANGERLLRAPEWSAYASINYDMAVGDGKVPVNLSYSYKGSYNFDFVHDPSTNVLRQKAYGLVNGRIGYESGKGGWSIGAWVNNLFNKAYFDDVVAAGSGIRASYGAPRTYGADATFRF